jgi:hypothetical protein
MNSAKVILLPIEWKPGNAPNVLEGFIGIYKVGSITLEGDCFLIDVWKEEVKIASCELKFTEQTIASCLEQSKNYVTSKITDRIINEQSVLNNFIES